MRVLEGIYGFIAGEPQLSWNDEGKARFYARIGINHYERRDGGGWRQLKPTFHHLVQFDQAAQRSYERFRKGDDFIALGYTREYTQTVNGQPKAEEQFIAYRLSHDPNTTAYEIHRRPRSAHRTADQATDRAAGAEADPTER